jgi:5-methylthioadenosine/S-adenosylhomocysteine deaminase
MTPIDSLIEASWIIPVESPGKDTNDLVLEDHALIIHQGRIHDILPQTEARHRYQASEHHQLPGHALIPGLINAHCHSPMNLLRGLADDLPLMTWLKEHIWPTEQRWMGEGFVTDGSRLAIAEMLRGGITCFNDMYFHPDRTAQLAAETGIRAVIGLILLDFPSSWGQGAEDYLHKGLKLRDRYRGHPQVSFSFAPHAPYSVSDASFERLMTLANELEPALPLHIHVHETRDEIEQSLAQYGERPLQRLQRLGLVGPELCAIHLTQLEPDEIELLAESGSQAVHCPESNLKLASGFCPTVQLLAAGVNVALGTDGAASNNDLDMFSEMRTAALLAKGVSGDPTQVPASQALRMATLNGARALGLGDITGSLTIGKAADVVAVDLNDITSRPIYHPISQLVYATGRHQVKEVWVAGRQLLKKGLLTCLDPQQLLRDAALWQAKIAGQICSD